MNQPNVFAAISDLNRRLILDLLRDQGPLKAGEIVAHLSHISQPAVSKHLRVLRRAKLVQSRRRGRENWYELNPNPLQHIAAWLLPYETVWDQRLQQLKQLAESGAQRDETS